MKKVLALVLALALTLCCAASLAEGYGLGIQTGIGSSKAATAEKDGNAQVDSTVCALVVDDEGKIVSCLFDVAQTKIAFNAAGEITADMDAEIRSKREKGPDYGMLKASPIGKEWDEQAAFLAAYCVGKTLDEVVAGVAEADGYPTNADVLAGCTMHTTDFLKALEKAYAMATAK